MITIKKKYIAFIVGLFSLTQVRLVGMFAISEFILLATIVYILSNNPLLFRAAFQNKQMNTLLCLCLFWIFSTVISDLINNTSIIDLFKGLGGSVLLFFSLIFFYWLFSQQLDLMYLFLWGVAISMVLSFFIFIPAALEARIVEGGSSLMDTGGLWNRLLARAVRAFVFAFSFRYYSKYPYLVCIIFFLNLFNGLLAGSRGSFLVGFLSVLLIIFFARYAKIDYLMPRTIFYVKKKMPLIILILIIGFFAVKNIYSFAAEQGYMGEASKRKYEKQTNSKLGLLSGRGSFVAAFLAISDKPLFGHGSFAKDTEGYALQAAELVGDSEDINRAYKWRGQRYIPSHSHLTGAWVQNGVLGALFWIYALFLIFRFLLKYAYIYPKFFGYIIPASFSTVWSIFFSGFWNRIGLGAFFAFIIIMMEQIDRKKDLLSYETNRSANIIST